MEVLVTKELTRTGQLKAITCRVYYIDLRVCLLLCLLYAKSLYSSIKGILGNMLNQ